MPKIPTGAVFWTYFTTLTSHGVTSLDITLKSWPWLPSSISPVTLIMHQTTKYVNSQGKIPAKPELLFCTVSAPVVLLGLGGSYSHTTRWIDGWMHSYGLLWSEIMRLSHQAYSVLLSPFLCKHNMVHLLYTSYMFLIYTRTDILLSFILYILVK